MDVISREREVLSHEIKDSITSRQEEKGRRKKFGSIYDPCKKAVSAIQQEHEREMNEALTSLLLSTLSENTRRIYQKPCQGRKSQNTVITKGRDRCQVNHEER